VSKKGIGKKNVAYGEENWLYLHYKRGWCVMQPASVRVPALFLELAESFRLDRLI